VEVAVRLEDLLMSLNGLTPDELRQVEAKCKALRGLAKARADQPLTAAYAQSDTDRYDYILRVAADVCRELGLDLRNIGRIKQSAAYKAFRTDVPATADLVVNLARKRSVEIALWKLVYKHVAKSRGWGLTMMLANTSQLPLFFNELFPGYFIGGLLPIALARLERRK
jgi:hypothetical protein